MLRVYGYSPLELDPSGNDLNTVHLTLSTDLIAFRLYEVQSEDRLTGIANDQRHNTTVDDIVKALSATCICSDSAIDALITIPSLDSGCLDRYELAHDRGSDWIGCQILILLKRTHQPPAGLRRSGQV